MIFGCRFVISVGCLALNGYDIQRDIKTYNWMRRFRSSSSRSCFSYFKFVFLFVLCIKFYIALLTCGSPASCFSLAIDDDGESGRGSELALDDPTLWFNVSCEMPLDDDTNVWLVLWVTFWNRASNGNLLAHNRCECDDTSVTLWPLKCGCEDDIWWCLYS